MAKKIYHLEDVPDTNSMNYVINDSAIDANGNLRNNVNVHLPNVSVQGSKPSFVRQGLKQLMQYLTTREDSYKNATKDFDFSTDLNYGTDNIVNVANGKIGKRDRLSMMGFVKDNDGGYYQLNPYYNPKLTESQKDSIAWEQVLGNFTANDPVERYALQCALTANEMNRNIGRATNGDAWTRHGAYGDSIIVANPNVSKKGMFGPFKPERLNRANGFYVQDHIDEHNLHTGDIVDLSHAGSGSRNDAWEKGDYNRANTHTGNILKLGPDKKDTYVIHYQGKNGVTIDPIAKLIGPGLFKSNYITAIRRPGTKNHPYTDANGNIKYNKR